MPETKKIGKGKYMYGEFLVECLALGWVASNRQGDLIKALTFKAVKHQINCFIGQSQRVHGKGCLCRTCRGLAPMLPDTETGPPMGDQRWVLSGGEWVLSHVTDAGTLVVPKPNFEGTKEVLDLIHAVAKLHDLDPTRISGIKTWDKVIAVHF